MQLSCDFMKDISWFQAFLQETNGVFIIHNELGNLACFYVDACNMGCGAICQDKAYHSKFPPAHPRAKPLHLSSGGIKCRYKGKLVQLFCDNTTAVAILQAGKGCDTFMQVCAKEVWLTCPIWNITLWVGHKPGEDLISSDDMLSHWHLGQLYKD